MQEEVTRGAVTLIVDGAKLSEQVFEKAGQAMWECRICGHLVVGPKAPEVCPVCGYAQAYFEVRAENY